MKAKNCKLKMSAADHLEECAAVDLSDIREIESSDAAGRVLQARITDSVYDLDDDHEDSLISRLREATGANYEWRYDYEPQPDGTTTVTLERV